MTWDELRKTCLEHGFKERMKNKSTTLRKKGVYLLYKGNINCIKIYIQNNRGGYEQWRYYYGRTPLKLEDALQYALNYKPPEIIERQWHEFPNKDLNSIGTIIRNNRACLGVAICRAIVIGIVGVKWPKADFNLIDDPEAEIYYVMACASADATFEVITNGEKIALCNASFNIESKEGFIKIINGRFGGKYKPHICDELSTLDHMVVKAAIEHFKTLTPWKGIDYSGGLR